MVTAVHKVVLTSNMQPQVVGMYNISIKKDDKIVSLTKSFHVTNAGKRCGATLSSRLTAAIDKCAA